MYRLDCASYRRTSTVTAGIAPGRGGQRIHETIPVYDNMADCLEEHPDIAAASIWRHYSSARDAALDAYELQNDPNGLLVQQRFTDFLSTLYV